MTFVFVLRLYSLCYVIQMRLTIPRMAFIILKSFVNATCPLVFLMILVHLKEL